MVIWVPASIITFNKGNFKLWKWSIKDLDSQKWIVFRVRKIFLWSSGRDFPSWNPSPCQLVSWWRVMARSLLKILRMVSSIWWSDNIQRRVYPILGNKRMRRTLLPNWRRNVRLLRIVSSIWWSNNIQRRVYPVLGNKRMRRTLLPNWRRNVRLLFKLPAWAWPPLGTSF